MTLRRVAFAAALLLATAPAFALKTDREKPMEILSENTEAFMGESETGETTLEGNVEINQGTLAVKADRAVIHRDSNTEISRAVLTGKPATIRQDLDEGGRMDARAREIDYDVQNERVVLTGDVVIVQPQGEIRGQRVTYDTKTGKVTGSGGEGGRVRMVVQPRGKKAD